LEGKLRTGTNYATENYSIYYANSKTSVDGKVQKINEGRNLYADGSFHKM
jgi:hypothetical protein